MAARTLVMSTSAGAAALVIVALASSVVFAQSTPAGHADYTVNSLSETVLRWSAMAAQSNEYRWSKTRDELLESLRGASLAGQFLIDSRAVGVSGSGGATFSQYRGVFGVPSAAPEGATMKSASEKCRSQTAAVRLGDVARHTADFDLTIRERSDRLAVELAGLQTIDFVGQIATIDLVADKGVCTIRLVVDLTTWRQAGDNAPASGPVTAGPVRVGGAVRPPQKVRHVNPVYPKEAQQSKAGALVLLDVIIAKDGTVKDAKVVRSAPLFDAAAIEAVRQWLFTPTTVNGAAVEVIVTVSLQFAPQ